MLNNLPYNDCSDFHIKKTDELLNVIKEHKPYINKITFYLVSSYNSGEASFLYDNDDIYFVIFNVESSLESTYLKKGNSMIYNIKAKQLNFKTIEEEQFFIDKYPHNYDLKTHILDEIDMLMLSNINETAVQAVNMLGVSTDTSDLFNDIYLKVKDMPDNDKEAVTKWLEDQGYKSN